jgi:hypothetical protein
VKKFIKVLMFGGLFVGCMVTIVHAEETGGQDSKPTNTLDRIVPAKHFSVSSYRELSPSYYQPSPLPIKGLAMYYNPGVMEQVLKRQLGWGDVTECDECIGRVALLREGDMDRRIWLQRPGHAAEGPFWVVDQAAEHDVPDLLKRNWAVDVDYETAMRWEMRGPIPIIVLADPSQAVPLTDELTVAGNNAGKTGNP